MRERRPLLTTRWLALGAGGGAACALALDQFGLAGPWQKIALLLVLLAMFAISAWLYATHERERDLSETSEKARHGEELIERLQQEINHHTRLEHELTQAKQAAESAVLAPADVAHYRAAGADVVLVGEALVTNDPVSTLRSFLEAGA